ncbi:hypothetical protein L489_5680 [Bordetella bronchiseptica 00-P-2730]|uniref:hypothetical protein n=1 Tax=Bordetella bronchiseptica TaxID=518 RepID=UPI00045BA2EB|nr:hypothetical protein [Bordetella bronchiseptica]KCV27870.1 hypothetical protein L489_5680 [Bordetella bronchiseptica 00-P-2730]
MTASQPILAELEQAPRLSYGFLWADYAELICLTSEDGIYSPAFLRDSVQEEEDIRTDAEDGNGEEASIAASLLEAVTETETGGETDETLNSNRTVDEKIERVWDSIRRRLEVRRSSLDDDWPFTFKDNVLERRFDADNSVHRLYIALLVASALRFCPLGRRKEVEASLEEIGYHLIKGLLPSGWQVRPFGAHQSLPGAYTGTLYQKYRALADDIHPLHVADEDFFDPRDTGDGGIDVVAWHPFADSRGNIPVLMAQCGCSPQEWEHKQYEASPMQQETKIMPHHPAMAMYIMPHDLRDTNGAWDRKSHVGRVIMIDRSRIVKLASQHDFAKNLPEWPFVREAATLNIPAPR